MASPSVTYTFSNGSTADADQINTNFGNIISSLTDSTKALSIEALTCAGNVAFNANTTIGNATADDLTVTARLASDLIPKTDSAYDLGSTSLRYAEAWIDAITGTDLTMAGTTSLDGAVTINTSEADKDFRVGANSITNALFVDGSNGNVGIGGTSSGDKLYATTADGTYYTASFINNNGANTNAAAVLKLVSSSARSDSSILACLGDTSSVAFVVRADGNVGIGGTPHAYNSTNSGLALGGTASMQNLTTAAAGNQFLIGNNVYNDGSGYKRILSGDEACYIDMSDGRFRFYTDATTTGNVTPSLAMHIAASGNVGIGTTPSATFDVHNTGTTPQVIKVRAESESYADDCVDIGCYRSGSTAYDFLTCTSDANGSSGGPDMEFRLAGDGDGTCDGSWTGGGADYAEYFEWADGNPDNDDRRGYSVSLVGDKIKIAENGDSIIGVVSGNPSVVGDSAALKWAGKYLRDEFGSRILDEDGYRVLNPDYDHEVEYVPREDRPEWDCVGLLGKLRLRKGQVVADSWIKMRDISDNVEEWLVR